MTPQSELQALRSLAVTSGFAPACSLESAMRQTGFVQADPIRAPAPAQDLILFQRVQDYRLGDLVRSYPSLELEEGYLYAYGFLTRELWRLRQHTNPPECLPELERQVLRAVQERGPIHPGQLTALLGKNLVRNAWGGRSRATTRALQSLHWHGLVRVARRENGVRVYEVAPQAAPDLSPTERLEQLLLAEASILSPVRRSLLEGRLGLRMRKLSLPEAATPRQIVRELVHRGVLKEQKVDGVSYLWPEPLSSEQNIPPRVRLLSPFDPLLWDRDRFEQFWGWSYRFEAYTPVAKRVRGYYAMPILYGETVPGWANVTVKGGKLDLELGFVETRPTAPRFHAELDAEIARLERFLGLRTGKA